MTDVEKFRSRAIEEREDAWSTAAYAVEFGVMRDEAPPLLFANKNNDRANLYDRAADALEFVERGRGAEALEIGHSGGLLIPSDSYDGELLRMCEWFPDSSRLPRSHLAARLIATALKLLESGTP